ncbi:MULTISPECIES: aminotransferase class V-fold PLP-dependent enzyme [unclassified Nocardia]|uniref:pyridoxal phosphate-dependent decarboxylase family protein n=1 Tax=unclassified Nocardia TaxID=2637762 RepID=UPI001CE3C438|nr:MULTISPECIES: aminotransferase class V-fold PLP-dependent enzyme [unclassified Nocardia]
MTEFPLEPDAASIREMGMRAIDFVADQVEKWPRTPVWRPGAANPLLAPPPELPGELDKLLSMVGDAADRGLNTASAGYLAYFPAGGLISAAIGEMIAMSLNRFTGFAALAPELVAIEHSVIAWLCGLFGLPEGAGGLITTGGSLATLAAVVAARERGGGPDSVLYVGEYAHHCIAKAARLCGLPDDRIRIVPSTAELRMDTGRAAEMIAADRARGLRPFLLAAAAGSTSTGLIDPLDELGELAEREGLWFHVDGAYGAPFQLTERGRALLTGIERADSIVLDPHKSMFLPYGTGVVLVRSESALRAAHSGDGSYLHDIERCAGLPDYADIGPELSREWRGLRLWLPLHLHGIGAFRRALTEKLELAEFAHRELMRIPRLEVPWAPDLTVVGFRHRDGAAASRQLLERINGAGRYFLSSTEVAGAYTVRMCPLSVRTHAEQMAEVIRDIAAAV